MPPRRLHSATSIAAVIAGIYALFATAWIVLSDRALVAIAFEREAAIHTYKGLLFVLVTTVVLFSVTRSWVGRAVASANSALAAKESLDRLHRLLRDASSLVIRASDEQELFEGICAAAVETGGFSGAWVEEADLDTDQVIMRAAFGMDTDVSSETGFDTGSCDPGQCPARRVLASGEPVVEDGLCTITGNMWPHSACDIDEGSTATFPVRRAGDAVAAFSVFSSASGAFGEQEIAVLEQLARDLSVGLERLHAERESARMRDRLEASERRYRGLFSVNPRPMLVYDIETLAILDVNDTAIDKYGYTREEFLAMTIADMRPPEDIPRLLENVSRVTEGVDFAGLWRHVTKDGRVINVDITSHVVDYGGRRAELVLAEDVTALVETASELKATATRLSALVDTAPVAIIAVDCDGQVTLWNPAAEQMFGWSAEETAGRFNPIISEAERPGYLARLRGYVAGDPMSGKSEGRLKTRDDRLIDAVVYNARPVNESIGAEEIMSFIIDVTERKLAASELARYRERLEELVEERTRELHRVNEELRRATQIKSEFLANMSHELRTPLNSIIGFAGILSQGMAGDLTEEQAKQIEMVYRSGKHLLELINDILDLSRIEAGRMKLDARRFNLSNVVETAATELTPQAKEKGLQFDVHVPRPLHIRSDPTKINQILYNLIGNAVKFTEEGRVKVTVESRDSEVEIRVVDTGPGIAQEDQEAIFDEFYQSRRIVEVKPAGTGLGLSISRKLARMLGGDISVVSEVGAGSEFKFVIPVEQTADLGDRSKDSQSGA